MIVLYLKVWVTSALTATAFGRTAAGFAIRFVIGVTPNALTGQPEDGFRTKMFIFRQNPRSGAAR